MISQRQKGGAIISVYKGKFTAERITAKIMTDDTDRKNWYSKSTESPNGEWFKSTIREDKTIIHRAAQQQRISRGVKL